MLHRGVYQGVVEVGRDVGAKARVPLGSAGRRVGLLLRRHRRLGQRRIEGEAGALDDQDIVAVLTIMIPVLLEQETELAVRRADADQHDAFTAISPSSSAGRFRPL
jgi:hypothetical protein